VTLQDQISIGSLTSAFPSEMVGGVVKAKGTREQRGRAVPTRLQGSLSTPPQLRGWLRHVGDVRRALGG
jgi:hypothetical protein